MGSIIGDEKIRVTAEQFQPGDREGRTQFQPISRDWVSFLAEYFTYSSATRIAINGIKPTEFFQKGDRLRILQTTYKWFVVTTVVDSTDTTGYIDVTAGIDYTVANAAITEIASSRFTKPEGFPETFEFTAAPFAVSGSISSVTPVANANYFTIDPSGLLRLNVDVQFTASSASEVFLPLPVTTVDTGSSGSTGSDWILTVTNGTPTNGYYTFLSGGNFAEPSIQPVDGIFDLASAVSGVIEARLA